MNVFVGISNLKPDGKRNTIPMGDTSLALVNATYNDTELYASVQYPDGQRAAVCHAFIISILTPRALPTDYVIKRIYTVIFRRRSLR